jgi:phospholipase/carboxylesterase
VWLHGEGQSEHALRRVIYHVSLRNYVAVGPRGTEARQNRSGVAAFGWSQTPDGVEAADERVTEAISLVRSKFHISRQRIFVAGLGAGGTMALRLALAHPNLFAGAISLDGPMPRTDQPLARINDLRGMPLLLSANIQEPPSCFGDKLCQDLRLLHAADLTVSLRLYSGSSSVLPAMLADIDRWIMDIVCPSTSSAPRDKR